jgi:hypothetical protein
VAAALVATKIDAGWEGSLRRQALFDLLYGPTDWATSAAIIAACNLARTEPRLAAGIRDLLSPLLDKPVSPIHWAHVVEVLLPCAAWIPGEDERFSTWGARVQKQMQAG